MKTLLLLMVLGLLEPCWSSAISYNVPSAYVTYLGKLMSREEKAFELDDIKIIHFLDILKPKLKVRSGYDFKFSTLPKNSGAYEAYMGEIGHVDYEFWNVDLHSSNFVTGIDGKRFYHSMDYMVLSPYSALNFEAKTLKTQKSCEGCGDMGKEDGFLLQFKNLSLSVKGSFTHASDEYKVIGELKGAQVNLTVHLKHNETSLKTLDTTCTIRAPLRFVLEGPHSLSFRLNGSIHKILRKEVCDKLTSLAREVLDQVDSEEDLVFQLHQDLYFNMSINKFSVDSFGFNLQHEGSFLNRLSDISKKTNKKFCVRKLESQDILKYINLFATKKIEMLCEMIDKREKKNYDLLNANEAEKSIPTVVSTEELLDHFKKLSNFFFETSRPTNSDLMTTPNYNQFVNFRHKRNVSIAWKLNEESTREMTTKTTEAKLIAETKPSTETATKTLSPTTPFPSTPSTFISSKSNEELEKENAKIVLRIRTATFNSFLHSLVSSQATKFQLSDHDLESFCMRNKDSALCSSIKKCPKMSELTKKFFLTFELLAKDDGKYVVFDGDAISTNTTTLLVFNGNRINLNQALKTKLKFEENILSYRLLSYNLGMMAEEKLHKLFHPNVLVDYLRGKTTFYKISGRFILPESLSMTSDFKNDVWTLKIGPREGA